MRIGNTTWVFLKSSQVLIGENINSSDLLKYDIQTLIVESRDILVHLINELEF